jgi:hypothetical protein
MCVLYKLLNTLDSVEHFEIGNNMRNMGVLVCLVVLIQDMYTKQEGKVEFE